MAKTILIVDDSAVMRQMVSHTLRGAGFEVIQGVNGADALRVAAGATVHLVVTDFNMPVMGGVDLIQKLRAMPKFRFTPILLLTTETEESRKSQARAAGATGWVTKPFDPERLVRLVNQLVP